MDTIKIMFKILGRIFFWFAVICVFSIPLTFTMSYVLTGFSKAEFMKFVDTIPVQNFCWYTIPVITACMIIMVIAFKRMMEGTYNRRN
jgi:hypothetical protein